jgi:hypothetical protein
MTHTCTVDVADTYVDMTGQKRARWRKLATEEHTPHTAEVRTRELRLPHGAARVACATFEAVALRQAFGLKLIEPG